MKTLFTFTGGVGVTLFFLLAPAFSHADILNPSFGILPQGSVCAPLRITNIQPSIYSGDLHSFSFTVSDSSYVAVGAQMREEMIPFTQIARQGTGIPGETRIIVGTRSIPVSTSLPISVSLLSTKGQGSPVCTSTFSIVLSGGSVSQIPTNGVTTKNTDLNWHSKNQQTLPKNNIQARTQTSGHDGNPVLAKTPNMPVLGVSDTSRATPAKITSSIKDACSTTRGSSNVWSILLALYALFAAYCALVKPGILQRSAESLAAAIVLPFVGLVLFWYFVTVCRAGEWVQLLTPAIALIALAIAFWDDSTTENTRLPL